MDSTSTSILYYKHNSECPVPRDYNIIPRYSNNIAIYTAVCAHYRGDVIVGKIVLAQIIILLY